MGMPVAAAPGLRSADGAQLSARIGFAPEQGRAGSPAPESALGPGVSSGPHLPARRPQRLQVGAPVSAGFWALHVLLFSRVLSFMVEGQGCALIAFHG